MNKRKRVLIIGGGISGLSAAWYLKEDAHVTVIEKHDSIGGWIHSQYQKGAVFEIGPRTFQVGKCQDLLHLISELGLKEDLIFSDPLVQDRYLFQDGKLQKMSPFSAIGWYCFLALLQEWKIKPYLEDESILAFTTRRFGKKIASNLFDPLTVGMYGGDFAKLSMRSCFAKMKRWEASYGSVTKGFLNERGPLLTYFPKRKKTLFSLKEGIGSLTTRMGENLQGCIKLEERIQKIRHLSQEVVVTTNTGEIHADALIFATDCKTAARWLKSIDMVSTDLLQSIPLLDIDLFQIGFEQTFSRARGLGYLVPSKDRKHVLGTVFDSDIFPTQNGPFATRMTAFARFDNKDRESAATKVVEELQTQMRFSMVPDVIVHHHLERCFPQYSVGHDRKVQKLEKSLTRCAPRIFLVGNYLEGVSVNDCVRRAKKVSNQVMESLSAHKS